MYSSCSYAPTCSSPSPALRRYQWCACACACVFFGAICATMRRYDFGGTPLWQSPRPTSAAMGIPSCSCGQLRVFELQVGAASCFLSATQSIIAAIPHRVPWTPSCGAPYLSPLLSLFFFAHAGATHVAAVCAVHIGCPTMQLAAV